MDFRAQKGVVECVLPRNIKDICIGKWYALGNLQKRRKKMREAIYYT